GALLPPMATTKPPIVNPDDLLVRGIGQRALTASIFNYTVGSGIFVLPAIVVANLGSAAPLAYLMCAAIMAFIVLIFAEAGSRVHATGGPYAYVEVALGPFLGLISGVLLCMSDIAAAGAVSNILGHSIARLVGIQASLAPPLITTLIVVSLAAINIRGVRSGTRVVEISTVAKLIPLLLFVLVGAFFITPANLVITEVPPLGEVTRTAGILFFAFAGIEAALQPSGEVRDSSRTVPRAAIFALGMATLLYLAVQAVALGLSGAALANDRVAPIATAASTFAGRPAYTFLLIGTTVSMFGWMTGSILAGPRGVFALARDGFLPRAIARVHPIRRTPYVAISLYAGIALVLAWSGSFEQLAIITNLASLALYFLCAIAVWGLRRKNIRGEGEPFVIPGGPTVPILACILIAWVISQTITQREFVGFGIALVLSVVVYLLRRPRGIDAAKAE
ncbi:MAG TPA: amino acid permease, partial [Longimicrobiales bacterium]